MNRAALMIVCCCAITLAGCTMPFLAYIRNMSSSAAVVNVVLRSKGQMRTLPNSVAIANKIVPFRAGFRQSFYKRGYMHWIDTVHFSFSVLPGTTVDLTDMAGRFVNGHPREDVFVTVSFGHTVDTLINGYGNFRHNKFGYKNVGVSLPVYYYDIHNR